jgi:hypothetical protein
MLRVSVFGVLIFSLSAMAGFFAGHQAIIHNQCALSEASVRSVTTVPIPQGAVVLDVKTSSGGGGGPAIPYVQTPNIQTPKSILVDY